MPTSITRRGLPLIAVTAISLVAGLATASQAGAATYYACVKKGGAAHVFAKKPKCKSGESKISWNNVGPAGRNGTNGRNGGNGANGKNGANGSNGSNGTTGFTSVLPAGQSEFGTWAGNNLGAGPFYIPISFNIPLAAKPAVTIIALKGAPTTDCPGSPVEPKATSGHLCFYTAQFTATEQFFFDPIVPGGVAQGDTFGVVLALSGTGVGYGTWAVTG